MSTSDNELPERNISSNLSLLDLPSDVIVGFFNYLTLGSLCKLCLTCRHLHDLVTKFGWTSYLRLNPRYAQGLYCVENIWSPFERLRYNTIAERNWDNNTFIARPLFAPWRGKLLPVLAISRSRFVAAAGSRLYVFTFACASNKTDSPVMHFEAMHTVSRTDAEPQARHDITGIAFMPDGGEDSTLLAGFADGYVMQVTLPEGGQQVLEKPPSLTLKTLYTGGDMIESLSLSGNFSFTLSSSGKGVFRNVQTAVSSEIYLNERSWSSYISTVVAPYIALGTSSATPLTIHPIYESALSPDPSLFLSSIRGSSSATPTARESTAVYGITGPPPSFPGNPGQIIVAGWFDGRVRLYDLRTSSSSSYRPTSIGRSKPIPMLSPSLTLSDSWATESIYAVSTGGGAGYTVSAGTARHSVVAFWDLRSPRDGWSVHAPGNDASPVYALILENARAFGATQSRAFVCDFGAGVGAETYPPLAPCEAAVPRGRGRLDDSLKTTDGVHYHVTKYLHRKPMAVN